MGKDRRSGWHGNYGNVAGQCWKVTYATRASASAALRTAPNGDSTDGRELMPYKCERCSCWHLGHKSKRQHLPAHTNNSRKQPTPYGDTEER